MHFILLYGRFLPAFRLSDHHGPPVCSKANCRWLQGNKSNLSKSMLQPGPEIYNLSVTTKKHFSFQGRSLFALHVRGQHSSAVPPSPSPSHLPASLDSQSNNGISFSEFLCLGHDCSHPHQEMPWAGLLPALSFCRPPKGSAWTCNKELCQKTTTLCEGLHPVLH